MCGYLPNAFPDIPEHIEHLPRFKSFDDCIEDLQYRQAGTPVERIEAQGFEVVPGKTRGDEIVVRTMKESFDEWIAESNNTEAEKMERGVDDTGKMVQRLKSTPKSPVKD